MFGLESSYCAMSDVNDLIFDRLCVRSVLCLHGFVLCMRAPTFQGSGFRVLA